MLNRSTRGIINCKFNRRIVLLLLVIGRVPLSTNAAQFCVILDPYFYRSPIKVNLGRNDENGSGLLPDGG